MDLNELIYSEDLHIRRLEELVQQSISEERLLSGKLLEIESDEGMTLSQKLSDKVASFGGSWTFLIGFMGFIFIWIVLNSVWLLDRSVDPYPYIFLNLILSCIAAIQAPIIMMSQNRQEDKDRIRARSDYMINLKSEMEIRGLHSKIDLLIADQMKTLFSVQKSQIEMLIQIQAKLDQK